MGMMMIPALMKSMLSVDRPFFFPSFFFLFSFLLCSALSSGSFTHNSLSARMKDFLFSS
jgi:hypothetical protein